ncbi:histidine--tRNA ligase [Patescibacteria group bacterium]|nr:MAG: histidine--tRNA ligase [Patescibacteria group bacterium]
MNENRKKIETSPYKGVRDFYPEDWFIEKYIFSVWHQTAERFGYSEYSSSPLEPAELYRAKSGEELVSEQTYTFTDRGGREVTLRPEMTPTLARMIAAKRRELTFPLRWFSIQNIFRYEQPQKGRLREHFQLNTDIFGVLGLEAEVEIISLASAILKNFGALDADFEIKINSKKLLEDLFVSFSISAEQAKKLSQILDKKEKIGRDVYEASVKDLLGGKAGEVIYTLDVNDRLRERIEGTSSMKNMEELVSRLEAVGVRNLSFTPTLTRGFEYYTDIVFEVFDTDPANRRALLGGGRYDNLLEIFGADPIPAIGFGFGDVTLKDFLAGRKLLPEYHAGAALYLCRAGDTAYEELVRFADRLRKAGLGVTLDLSGKKVGDQIKIADRLRISFVLCFGEEEIKSKKYRVKNLKSGEEKILREEEISEFIRSYS